ncbi:MAG: cellulase family glycosylhydrolase [Burkholderiales bacterium]
MSEDFEGACATVSARWPAQSYSGFPCSGQMILNTDPAYVRSGSQSLRMIYQGGEIYGGFVDQDWADRTHREIWVTYDTYMKSPFYTGGDTAHGVGGIGTKGLYTFMYSASRGQYWGWVPNWIWGGKQHTLGTQGCVENDNGIPYDSTFFYQNQTAYSQQENVWVRHEVHYKLNTPGQADGLLEEYQTAGAGARTLTTRYTNRRCLDADTSGQMPSDAKWGRIRLYRQYGQGDLYIDNVTVTTEPVGSIGTLPPPPSTDTVAPTVPTNVTVSNTVPLQHTVSWTASTDASSPITYTVDYCTGAACTPATTLTSTTSVSATHGSLTGGTVYGYRVRARDPNGNTSAVTSTVYSTANSAAQANAISITSNGLFAINSTPAFFLDATYFDGQNWRASDIDTLAAAGFNNIRVFANYAEATYGGARSVCTADGSLNTTRRDVIQALIDYAQTKSMVVTLIIMSEQTNTLIPVDANKQTCVTNIINAYKAEPLVIFDLNNEHTEVANTWINAPSEYATYHALAKAACASCIIFASSTSPFSHPQSNGTTIETTYFDGMLNAGVDVIAFHDYRGSQWDIETGPRTTTLRNYLSSKGRADIPVYFSEPCRWDFVADCNKPASAYFQAAAEMKAAGGAGWTWHHGYFDFSTQTLFQQLNPTESTVYQGLAAALSSGSGGVPVALATYDFAGTFGSVFTGGYTGHDTPVQTGGKLRANATGTESMAQYTGVQTALTTLDTCTRANEGPPPSASWTTLSGNGLKVLSNQCGSDAASVTVNDAAAWGTDFTDDQVVQATLAALPTNAAADYGLLVVRAQASTGGYNNLYELEIDRSAGTWRKRLYKIASGVYTQLGASETSTVSAGAVFKLTAVGNTISAYQDGVLIMQAVDTTFPTGGYVGIGSFKATTASTTRWTNLAGGNYVAGDTFATPNNHGATVEISTANGTSPQYGRVMVRLQDSPTYSGYDCRFSRNATPTASIARKDANNPTTLTSSSAVTWAATDVVGCYADGSRIYMERNGTEILSTTDTTYPYGDTGLYMGTAGSPLADFELDNFTVYEYGAPTPACTPSITTAVADATGATVTWPAACPPTQIRVETALSTQVFDLSAFPSGRYTPMGGWKQEDQFACFKAIDTQGVINQTDYVCDSLAGLIATDTTAPTMTLLSPTSALPAGTTSTTAAFTTDESATCRWDTSNTTYALMANTATAAGLTHTFTATGLTNNTTTNFYGHCQDVADPTPNVTTTALLIPITVTSPTADTTPPSTVTGLVAVAISPSQLSLTHALSTDAGGAPTYQAWISTDNVTFTFAHSYTGVPTTIDGLPPSTMYYVKVLSIDPSLNLAAAYSNVASATTPNILDLTAPSDPSGLIVTGTYTQSATIAWTPGRDDRSNVTTNVEICSGSAACTAFSLVGTTNQSTYTIPGLSPSTIYRVRIKFSDQAGNVSINYSDRVTFTTAATGIILPRAPVAYSQPRLPRQ